MNSELSGPDPDRSYFGDILYRIRVRFFLASFGALLIVLYHVIKLIPGASSFVFLHLIRPFHNFTASLCDKVSFAVIEPLMYLVFAAILIYLVSALISMFGKREFLYRIISIPVTLIMCFTLIYGGFCVLWGFYYAGPSAGEVCGITVPEDGIVHADLIKTDEYFVNLANEYSERVTRDTGGHFAASGDPYTYALKLYDNMEESFPMIEAPAHRPKKYFISRFMSYMDFTGFFSPFTGEACINTDSPSSMTPVTIAHELAHQRGIGAEDEANFVAVVACMEDGDPDFVYSASLMALIHLQNALYKSGDTDAWNTIKDTYSPGVIADLEENSTYWKKYRDTAANRVTTQTYDAFLKSYDQELGRETYGACVDLLVEYYSRIW